MSSFFNNSELTVIRNHLEDPTLDIFLDKKWSSHNPSYRELIHDDIKTKENRSHSSISHTTELGGYVTSQLSNSHIGFDIEVISRIREDVARRVCLTEQEFNCAPSAAALWVAKEASFKALKGFNQPQVVSEIEIGSWQTGNSQYETCRILNLQKFKVSVAKGIILTKSGLVFCFFSARP